MPSSLHSPKRLHVTGGRGRLASLVADHFCAPSYVTTLYSRTPASGLLPLDQLIAAPDWTSNDVVLHLAWSTLPATSEKNPSTETQHDLPLLERLLTTLARQPNDRRPHFIFFSSGGTVYGDAQERASCEDDICRPIGSYGRSKLVAEQLILDAAKSHELPTTILRISNPYGYPVPGKRPQGIIPHAIRAAVDQTTLTLWGDGSARKDFLYYTDFLAALQLIVDQRLQGTFNIAAGESHSIHDVITLVEEHTKRAVKTTTQPAPSWDVQDSRLDVTRFKTATGWSPQVSLSEGIRRSVAGYLDD